MNLDDFAISVDSECISQDFDDVDLYGERIEEENNESNIILN